jgi:hypothetical protein
MKSVSKLIQECQAVFNSFIRKRDAGLPCISCDAPYFTDCGHLFKKSTRPAMRFNPMAAHGQCRECNSKDDGNYEKFCQGIAVRYGIEYLTTVIQEANNSRKTDHKWSRSELEDMIKYFHFEIKKLQK